MCESTNCAAHNRRNVSELDRPDPYMITYVGRWAIHTEQARDQSAIKNPLIMAEIKAVLLGVMLGLDTSRKAREIMDRIPMVPGVIVYNVGDGTISDILDDSGKAREELIEHAEVSNLPGDTLVALHARTVDQYYDIP